ncbi:MAG: protease modulator HflC [Rhodobacteraceae bacterium]|nr:protease modulator HflC [Paracoccaceae bacterium]
MKKLPIIIGIFVAAVFLLLSAIFIVDEREKALVLQFGQVRLVKEDPGIAFRIPFIQEVVKYDDRILSLDIAPLEVNFKDKRRLQVDAFARYRISDVVRFRQAVGTGGIRTADERLANNLNAALLEVLGQVDSGAVLSDDRIELMARIRDEAIAKSINLGIEVIDVRIKRAELPEQNLTATFDRMNAEREREARDERARGSEAAQRVRAQADRTAIETVSIAQRDANIIRGEADAERNAIFAEAYGRDPEFFEFYRSLAAYENALRGNNSSMVLSPNGEFFNYFVSPNGRPAAE